MTPGFVVIRIPRNGSRWIVESKIFGTNREDFDRAWILRSAKEWRDFIQSEHPRDTVFIVEYSEAFK